MPEVPEPIWELDPDKVQKTYDCCSAVCNNRLTPTVVTGILLRLLQAHFSSADYIMDDKLAPLVWTDDDFLDGTGSSPIHIGPLYGYDAAHLQTRPALLVFRQQLGAQKLPMGSKTVTSLDANGNYSGEKMVVPLTCTHGIRCTAKTSFAAERLGEEVFYFMLELSYAIKQDFPFSTFDAKGLTPPRMLQEESNENFYADVIVDWKHMYGWTLAPIAPILKKVRAGLSPV